MGKIVVQTFLFNIDSNWLAGLFPSTVLLCILLRFITLYYNILQLSVQYQFISSKSTGAWKNLQDHKLKSHQSPQLTNFHLSVAAMCCRRSSRFSLFVKGKSQATPVSHLTQLRSFAAGFLSTTRPSQYQFRNELCSKQESEESAHKFYRDQFCRFTKEKHHRPWYIWYSNQKYSYLKNSRLHVASFNWCAAQQGLEGAWIPKGATWPAVDPAMHGSSHPKPGAGVFTVPPRKWSIYPVGNSGAQNVGWFKFS